MIPALKNIIQRYPLFLITIPLFIVTHIEQQYHHLIKYSFVYGVISRLFIAPLIVILLTYWLFRNLSKAGVFSCAILVVYYYFSDLKIWLSIKTQDNFFTSYSVLLPLIFLLLVLLFIRLKKRKTDLRKTIAFINIAFILFIVSDILLLVMNPTSQNKDRGDKLKTVSRNYIPCDSCTRPDIYYLLFDAYTSSTLLQSVFNYNNPIDSFLRSKQFYIVRHSRSNYNLTPFSISSCFNLDYLPHLDPDADFLMDNYLPGIYSVYKSELPRLLEKEGYSIVNNSVFDLENHPPRIPLYNSWHIDNLYNYHNIFKRMDNDIGWLVRKHVPLPAWPGSNIDYAGLRNDFLAKTLTSLQQTIRTPQNDPRFVYAHFILPHSPYSFDSSGNLITSPPEFGMTRPQLRTAYLQQLGYTNKIMQELVEDIFAHTKRPVVIIIQGDHGIRFPEKQDKDLQFPNLNAMYFYNQDYRQLKDTMTNINTFRVVLNTFFGKHFPMLRDTSYFLKYKG